MRLIMRGNIVMGLTFIAIMMGIFNVSGQMEIEERRVAIHMKNVAFGKVIETLIEKYDIPVGLEQSVWVKEEDGDFWFVPNRRPRSSELSEGIKMPELQFVRINQRISISFENAVVSDVIDEIVRQMPGYKWEMNDGVVNIIRHRDRDPLFEKLLDLKVSNLDLENPAIYMIASEILAMPELLDFANDNGLCVVNLDEISWKYSKRQHSGKIQFSDLTFRELLNNIAKIKGGGWTLREYRFLNNKRCIALHL